MQSNFLPKLINDPLGDPGVMVEFLCEQRALQFDLGDLSSTTNGELLKISHVFISHTHIDHFIGFDHLLRVVFGRGKTIDLYGPENFIANVTGKLAGFTWNLVDRYDESVTLEVTEVHADRLVKAKFKAIDWFKKSDEREIPFVDGILVDEDRFIVRTAILEYHIPCLGFSLEEKNHVNICKDRLEKMCYQSGPWLNELKKCVYEGKSDEYLLEVLSVAKGSQKRTLGQLKEELVLISPGQKISYVVDTVYNEANKRDVVDLVKESDIFFCESPFLAEEETRGLERCHLTARQAGLIAREANVKKLSVFHFSGRHTFRTEQLIQEAEEAFQGK
ncbi:ribonuclease Z [Candidatus Poribacteria bacterium]|nr:ribonuclease Z [Candidatus Poribacteria bacterium]